MRAKNSLKYFKQKRRTEVSGLSKNAMEGATSGRGHGTPDISGGTNNVHYVCQTTEVDSY